MDNEIMRVAASEIVLAETKAQIDVQIATAKAYPRDLAQVLKNIETFATMDEETAMECFYKLPRAGSYIEGISVRMAEIIANSWGNMRVQSRIVDNDGKVLTAQAVCHDLETNVAVMTEVKRKITDKNGRTFNEDMQVVTGNAACSIAFRNAVLKVVPKAYTHRIMERVKQVSLGNAATLEKRRNGAIEFFVKNGVTKEQLLEFLSKTKVEEIDTDDVANLLGIATAIKEGDTTAKNAILDVIEERKNKDEFTEKDATNLIKVIAKIASKEDLQEFIDMNAEALTKSERLRVYVDNRLKEFENEQKKD